MSNKYIDVEGLILPNKPLSNFHLNDAAKKLRINDFRGTFVRDELPNKPRLYECTKHWRLIDRWASLDMLVQGWTDQIKF